jgi:hypothetical protein
VATRCGLELRERTANVIQCDVRVWGELTRPFDLMQCAHRLRDRGCELDEVGWHSRIGLQCVESA